VRFRIAIFQRRIGLGARTGAAMVTELGFHRVRLVQCSWVANGLLASRRFHVRRSQCVRLETKARQ
jgi:hypothetical protein